MPWIDIRALRRLWDSKDTRIEITTDKLLDDEGRVRAAINLPSERLIRVNRDRWQEISDKKTKMAFALHEILGVARENDLHYQVSAWVFVIQPNVLEYGRLGAIRNGQSNCLLGDDCTEGGDWINLRVDLPNGKLTLGFPDGSYVETRCKENGTGTCSAEIPIGRGLINGILWGGCANRNKVYRVQIQPDGALSLETYTEEAACQQQQWAGEKPNDLDYKLYIPIPPARARK